MAHSPCRELVYESGGDVLMVHWRVRRLLGAASVFTGGCLVTAGLAFQASPPARGQPPDQVRPAIDEKRPGPRQNQIKPIDFEAVRPDRARLQHESPVCALAFSPDGKWLATGTHSGLVFVWD